MAELIGAYQPGSLSRSQPPLPELVVWASDHEPEWTTAPDRANLPPQESLGTAEVSKPGSGIRLEVGAAW